MGKDAALRIIEILENAGYRAYLVGGCVRDLLLGRTPDDWDVTTSARPGQILEHFGAQVLPTGLKHGTVTVRESGDSIEVTTFRIDGTYSDGRHPDRVTFAATVEEDLSRRDFTVNAMALDRSGARIDPFGGTSDLQRGVIRCVGLPQKRFEEDALRILRALRFASVLNFTIEEQTSKAIHEKAERLQQIAAERILAEMNKLLCGQGCVRILLEYADVIGKVIPELLPCVRFEQRNVHHCYDLYTHTVYAVSAVAAESVLRWTLLLHDIGKVNTFTLGEDGQGRFYGHAEQSALLAEKICRRLRMTRKDTERIVTLIRWHDRNIPRTGQEIGRAVAKLGVDCFRQLVSVKRADNLAQAEAYRWVQREIDQAERIFATLLEENACLRIKDLAINGTDLMALGYRGRSIGLLLERLLDGVITGEIENQRDCLLHSAEMLLP